MAFVYITGAAGSGKSTVQTALRALEFEVFDEDQPGIGSAHDKATGRAVRIPPASGRSAGGFDTHEWKVLGPALARLQRLAGMKVVILCVSRCFDA